MGTNTLQNSISTIKLILLLSQTPLQSDIKILEPVIIINQDQDLTCCLQPYPSLLHNQFYTNSIIDVKPVSYQDLQIVFKLQPCDIVALDPYSINTV